MDECPLDRDGGFRGCWTDHRSIQYRSDAREFPTRSHHLSMIWIRLSDRLGNQMFQYAAALAVANRLGAELAVDVSAYKN